MAKDKVNTIWKYHFRTVEEFTVSMPKGTEVLFVQTYHGVPTIFAEINSKEKDMEDRKFRVYPSTITSLFDSNHGKYIGTYLDGPIWFLFEVINSVYI